MNILVAFEFSGAVRDAFRRRGHNAWSCDLSPALSNSLYHFQCDVWLLLGLNWDMVIAHPECTNMTNSGVQWLTRKSRKSNPVQRRKDMLRDVENFNRLLDLPVKRLVIENPIMHGQAASRLIRPYSQIIHPYEFGGRETKSTCLWVKGLPLLRPTGITPKDKREQKVFHESPGIVNGLTRSQRRAITDPVVAEAFAGQWG